MSTLLDRRKSSGPAKVDARQGVSLLPQINLLPSEIRAARGVRALRVYLFCAVAIVLVLIAAVYVLAMGQASAAEDDLLAEQTRTTTLLTEKAKYAEVPVVIAQLEQTTLGLSLAASSEIQWKSYLDAIVAVTPEGTTISNVAVQANGPVEQGPTPLDPLQDFAPARITISAYSLTRPDSALWMQALDGITGLDNPRLYTSARRGIDPELGYETVLTIDASTLAYSGRFPFEVID